jgi:phosphoglycerol transferase MdoB-like AlkP superfamily enzyme
MKKVYERAEKFLKYPFLMCVVWGLVINLIIEVCARKTGILSLFTSQLLHHPMSFLFDWAFITLTLSLCQFFKRKYFVMLWVTVFWVTLGGMNGYVLTYRTNPMCFIDLSIFQFSWNFISKYITAFTIPLFGSLAVLVIIIAVIFFRKAPRTPVKWKHSLICTACCFLLSLGLLFDIGGLGIKKIKLTDMKTSYSNYGFVYCFFRGTVERGIDTPSTFEDEDSALETISTIEDETPEVKPNIIFIQLESFFDLNLLSDVSFSENPTPYYSYLKENYSWGKLSVPSLGAGTANTEFEVISQMDLDFFGTGEYPYKTVLKKECPETVVRDLKELGYTAYALHNNNATFYDRNSVFATLGFDEFTTKEYISNYTTTPRNWMKDQYLLPEIQKDLENTEGQDFIYTITVQTHGSYPTDYDPDNKIKVLYSDMDSDALINQVEYYANQMSETDDFIQSLCEYLDDFDEPTVVVMYGDHMPSLNIDTNELMFGDLFETEYVMYSNFDMEKKRQDVEAYQLASYVMGRLGMNNGVLTKIHQNCSDDENYLDILEQTEYDMLYGEKNCWNGESKYTPTDIQMGVSEIKIDKCYYQNNVLTVKGENFTPSSVIYINGEKQSGTTFVKDSKLMLQDVEVNSGDVITVVQVSDDFTELTSTEEYVFN